MNRPPPPPIPAAAELLAAADAARAVRLSPPARPAPGSADVDDTGGRDADSGGIDHALRVQAEIVAMRQARGERPIGWKIGFTNRSIWPLYGVEHPIWGPVYGSTVTLLDGTDTTVDVTRFAEPRLEPEIVIGLGASPALEADARSGDALRALAGCIEWVAHGFEIVHSVYPGWKFTAVQALAAQGLHGALLVGPRVPVDRLGSDPIGTLAAVHVRLHEHGRLVAEGRGSAVLDGPVQALAHLVAEFARRGRRLEAGAIVTTGTLTDAQPLLPGQQWHTTLDGAPLPGLSLAVRGG